MLADMNLDTLMMQKERIALSDCRLIMDELVDSVTQLKRNTYCRFHGCRLGNHYIAEGTGIDCDIHLGTGFIKLQRNQANNLTEMKKDACQSLMLMFDQVYFSKDIEEADSLSKRMH